MTGQDAIRVVIVDDHPVVRRGIAFSLMAFDDIQLVGEASSGDEAVQLCAALQPDVVLMDMIMPGMDGPTATRMLRERYPQMQVLALTSFPEGDLVRNALQAGAIGYLLKDIAIDELAQAIRATHAGQSTLAKAATQALLPVAPPNGVPGEQLTDRQREVLGLVAAGLTNQEIADRLVISLPTVRFHVSTILSRMGATNRAEAAALAIRHNLLR